MGADMHRTFGTLLALMVCASSYAQMLTVPLRHEVDGASDDLLTAGLGADGLRGAAPEFANPTKPTRTEIRRRAVYQNYRGLIDVAPEGGFGTTYGPINGLKVPGVELLVAVRAPRGDGRTTVMLQIPRTFDLMKPCLIVAASSGSRGIYGALPTAGEWGLRRGCAVAHTDKGTGVGLFDADRARGIRINGEVTEDLADPLLGFAPATVHSREAPRDRAPHSVLLKHFNAGVNPEADWGRHVLIAARVAFELLNREFPRREGDPLAPANTVVIAAGISNGGGAALRALEVDRGRMFDGAVVSEPNVHVTSRLPQFELVTGGARRTIRTRSLYETVVLHASLQRCAWLAETDTAAPLAAVARTAIASHAQWCADLAKLGLVLGADTAARATHARDQLIAEGVVPSALRLGALNVQLELWITVAATYASAYSKAPFDRMPCGFGLAPVDASGQPRAISDAEMAAAFSDIGGVPPAAAVSLVRRNTEGQRSAAAARTFDAVRCLADLSTNLRGGIRATEATARVGGRPVVVLHGRQDSLVPVNFSSRAYYVAAHQDRRGSAALRYYEVPRGQHFDAFLALPGMRDHHVAMQPHLNAAFELMYAHLTTAAALPPSQVVRDRIAAQPGDAGISIDARVLTVPE
jgi:hydroxybutyrate-dimer hydrolase